MKKWFMILLGLMLLLCGCGNHSAGQADQQKAKLILAENGKTEYKLVSYLSDSSAVRSLTSWLVVKTGATFPLADAGEKGIYFGMADDFSDVTAVDLLESYANYQITAWDGNLYVAVSSEEAVEAAVEELKNAIEKISEGTFGVNENMNIVKNMGGSSEHIPVFITGSGDMLELYDCGNSNYEVIYQSMDVSTAPGEIASYEAKMEAAGYALYSENNIGDNRFVTYLKGDTMIRCNYFPALAQFRIVYGPAGYLPETEPVECEKVMEPSMSIISMTDNMLCMVYQGTDGSFVVIDGSYGTDAVVSKTLNSGTVDERTITYQRDVEQDMDGLWNFLTENTPGGGRPQVTWMITHADPDHVGLPTKFIAKYAGQFDLNMACYNFPNIHEIGLTYGDDPDIYTAYAETFVSTVRDNYPDAVHYVYHTGDKLYVPGGEIEFLFTNEDYAPNAMTSMNHTSGVWRFTVEEATVLITGDAEQGLCDQMVKCFGDYLKSDALQCNHHGSNGATLGFYQAVDPTVCFWPCHQYHLDYDQRHLGTKAGYEFNLFLRQSEKVKAHYSCTETHTVLLPSLEEK